MNAIKRELTKKGILYEADEMKCIMKGAEYDMCERLVSITSDFIITVFHSAVLPSELRIYDRKSLLPIGGQDLYQDTTFNGEKIWNSYIFVTE